MILLPLKDFVGRVVTNQERVRFSEVDGYGHLNTSRYSEYIVNHRITAVEDQLKVSTLDMVNSLGVAFVVRRLDTSFLLPSFLGETLEIASWVENLQPSGFDLRVVVSSVKNKKTKATALMELRTIDLKTGKPVACPEALPSRAEIDPLTSCPTSVEYLASLQGSK